MPKKSMTRTQGGVLRRGLSCITREKHARDARRRVVRAEKQYAGVSVTAEEVVVTEASEAAAARFSIGCATGGDEFDAIAELVTDTAYENENEAATMSSYAANLKLSQLRQEQAALRVEARDTRRFVVGVAYDRERLVGCAYMKLRRESSLVASASSSSGDGDATASPSPFSSMSSFMSFLVHGGTSRAKDTQQQQEGGIGNEGDVFYLSNVCVRPSNRRRGIARGIMESLRAEAEHRGVRTLYAHVNVENEAARRLYVSLGFENLGTDASVKDDAAGRFDRNDVLLLRARV